MAGDRDLGHACWTGIGRRLINDAYGLRCQIRLIEVEEDQIAVCGLWSGRGSFDWRRCEGRRLRFVFPRATEPVTKLEAPHAGFTVKGLVVTEGGNDREGVDPINLIGSVRHEERGIERVAGDIVPVEPEIEKPIIADITVGNTDQRGGRPEIALPGISGRRADRPQGPINR